MTADQGDLPGPSLPDRKPRLGWWQRLRGGRKDRAPGSAPTIVNYVREAARVIDTNPTNIESNGAVALLYSSDTLRDALLTELREAGANGYLVGVGFGGIFSLLQGFASEPRGIVMADIRPEVVLGGRILIEGLSQSETFGDFQRRYLEMSASDYQQLAEKVLREDEALSARIPNPAMILNTPPNVWQKYLREPLRSGDLDIFAYIEQNFALLKKLASEGRISISYADLFTPGVINIIKGLPEFDNLKNIIYLSNAIEHSSRSLDGSTYREVFNRLNDNQQSLFVFSELRSGSGLNLQFTQNTERVISPGSGFYFRHAN